MRKRKKTSDKCATYIRSDTSVRAALPFGVPAGVALIVIAALFVYFPSLSGGFILDDNILLTDNPLIRASNGLYQFWCTTKPTDYWPATNTTFWIEWRLWGTNSTGYHVTNLILHIIEALLIWIILQKLSIPGSFLAALIFAVHPVNVESVAWIAQRKNLMAMLFFLLSILCYLKLEMGSAVRSHGRQWKRGTSEPGRVTPATPGRYGPALNLWYWLSLAAFLLAMLSKGSVAVFPLLLLGIVWWLRPLTKWDLVRTVPFCIVALALTAANLWFQVNRMGEVIRTIGFTERLLGAGGVVWFYLYKAILPINLAFIYPQWNIKADNLLWWLPLLAALVITVVVWRYRETWSRPLLFAWGFFCVALMPVMGFRDVGFMQYSLVADHYQHIAIIAVIALAVAGWSKWHQMVQSGGMHRSATIVAIVAVGALSFLTWRQNGVYRNAITLYQDTLKKNPACWLAHNNLGFIMTNANQMQEGAEHFQQALQLNPNYPDAYFNLGLAMAKTGRMSEAITHFKQAIQLKPNFPEAQNNLGNALRESGNVQEAIKHYQQTLQLKPDYADAYVNLALTYAQAGQPADAIATAQKAMDIGRSQGRTALVKQIEDWLKSYRAGR